METLSKAGNHNIKLFLKGSKNCGKTQNFLGKKIHTGNLTTPTSEITLTTPLTWNPLSPIPHHNTPFSPFSNLIL